MSRQAVKVFLACAFGAGIGSLIALQVAVMFCGIGLLVGGLAGYLSYEWKKVIMAVPKAYRATTNYRFPAHYCETVGWFGIYTASSMLWMPLVLFFVIGVFSLIPPANPAISLGPNMLCTGILGFYLAACLLATLLVAGVMLPGFAERAKKEGDADYAEGKAKLRHAAFIAFPPFVIFWHLPKLLIPHVRQTPQFFWGCIASMALSVIFVKRFCWNLFLLIHSEMRILCGIDAMIGAAMGFFAGSAIIGALAGGILGVFNYTVITELCLKRLGLIPIER
jgi:hypothetical protein